MIASEAEEEKEKIKMDKKHVCGGDCGVVCVALHFIARRKHLIIT